MRVRLDRPCDEQYRHEQEQPQRWAVTWACGHGRHDFPAQNTTRPAPVTMRNCPPEETGPRVPRLPAAIVASPGRGVLHSKPLRTADQCMIRTWSVAHGRHSVAAHARRPPATSGCARRCAQSQLLSCTPDRCLLCHGPPAGSDVRSADIHPRARGVQLIQGLVLRTWRAFTARGKQNRCGGSRSWIVGRKANAIDATSHHPNNACTMANGGRNTVKCRGAAIRVSP